MTKHYILKIDPHAPYEWEQCTLSDPITGLRPDFAGLVAEAAEDPGVYLVAVSIEVKVLEKASVRQLPFLLPSEMPVTSIEEMVAL